MANFLSELFAGRATLTAFVFLLLIWISYRVGGKHIDEVYENIRKRFRRAEPPLRLEQKIEALNKLIAESNVRLLEQQQVLDETKELAQRGLILADRYLQENIILKVENAQLVRRLGEKES